MRLLSPLTPLLIREVSYEMREEKVQCVLSGGAGPMLYRANLDFYYITLLKLQYAFIYRV